MAAIGSLQVSLGSLPGHPGWHPLLVRIEDEDGAVGWGEAAAAYSPCAEAIAAHILDAGERLVLGQDADDVDRLWERLRATGDCYGPGGVTAAAAAAIEIALQDLRGQRLGVGIHALHGGAHRRSLRAYANGWCYDRREPAAYAEAAQRVVADGFSALKFDPFRYSDGGFAVTPGPGQDSVGRWLRVAEERVAAVRAAIGPDVDLILECHAKFTPDVALRVIRALEPYGLTLVEEPIPAGNPVLMADLARRVGVPLAAGERLNHRLEVRELVESQAVALIQCDLGTTGIGEGLRIARYAEIHGIAYQPHNANSPLLTAASVQAGASAPNTRWIECFAYRPGDFLGFVADPLERRLHQGCLPLPEGPGLGVTVDEAFVRRFPTRTVTRRDGRVHAAAVG